MWVAARLGEFLLSKGVVPVDLRPGEAGRREPDAIFNINSERRGIEVACVSYGPRGSREAAEHAQDLWAIARDEPEKSRTLLRDGETPEEFLDRAPAFENFNADVGPFIQSLIDEKCGKEYSVPTYLVVDARMLHLPLTSAEDAQRVIPGLRVPRGCPLLGVFIVMQYNGSERLEFFEIK